MRLTSHWFTLAALLAGCSGGSLQAPVREASASPETAPAAKRAEDLHQTVGRLTSRRPVTQVSVGPGGIRSYTVSEGLGQVVVAKTNADGTVSSKCVDSAEDSRSFLGQAAAAPRSGSAQ